MCSLLYLSRAVHIPLVPLDGPSAWAGRLHGHSGPRRWLPSPLKSTTEHGQTEMHESRQGTCVRLSPVRCTLVMGRECRAATEAVPTISDPQISPDVERLRKGEQRQAVAHQLQHAGLYCGGGLKLALLVFTWYCEPPPSPYRPLPYPCNGDGQETPPNVLEHEPE